jgi:cell pole-organizing protein PopZ
MEDILASIRRILSEEEASAEGGLPAGPPDQHEDVLVLDPSMMVPEQKPVQPTQNPPSETPQPGPESQQSEARDPGSLVAPEAAAAAASSVGSLVRTLSSRSAQVHAGGPTIEDLVRDELRPMLKEWLDANLPPVVERLVRAEIERVVGRATP